MKDGRTWYARGAAGAVLFMILGLLAITSAGCGSAADAAKGTLKLGEADSGRAYKVRVDDTIEVVIPGNPTTGFSWTAALADKDAALLQLIGEPAYAAEASDGAVVGAGGIYTFTFLAAAKGEAVLRLAYARAWESVLPKKTFWVTLTIE
ncbi:MAG: protease inhibitor I42 family protein [bacterium]